MAGSEERHDDTSEALEIADSSSADDVESGSTKTRRSRLFCGIFHAGLIVYMGALAYGSYYLWEHKDDPAMNGTTMGNDTVSTIMTDAVTSALVNATTSLAQ